MGITVASDSFVCNRGPALLLRVLTKEMTPLAAKHEWAATRAAAAAQKEKQAFWLTNQTLPCRCCSDRVGTETWLPLHAFQVGSDADQLLMSVLEKGQALACYKCRCTELAWEERSREFVPCDMCHRCQSQI